jgi:hypothetical protein
LETVGKANDIFLCKSCQFIDYTGEVEFVGVGGGHVGEGIDLLLDRGEVNRNSNVDIGHLSTDFANRVEDNVVVMVREGGGKSVGGRMDLKTGEE